jgi:hypothetical protein
VELAAIIRELLDHLPRAIGAVVCDWEGEAIACALGAADVPAGAKELARDHVPRALELTMPVSEFLIRLGAAEPAALLRMFEESGKKRGTGELSWLEARYEAVEMLVCRLPNEFYLVVVLRRPAVAAEARRHMVRASAMLVEHVS